jgi:hypothetical protein
MILGMSVLLAALTFAGAPTTTPVTCNPDLRSGEEGLTHWTTSPADPSSASITLGSNACAALLLLAVSPRERQEIAVLNPGRNLQVLEGAILAVLHEASHVALQTTDETTVECRAVSLLPDFLSKYLSGSELSAALDFARQSDAFLPPAYHARSC